MVQLIKKLLDKLFTLTAFISAVCLTIHYMPAALIKGTYNFWSDNVVFLLFPLVMLVSAVLLILDFFSLRIKIIQDQAWKIFAAIGIVPILPIASFGLIWLVFCIIDYIKQFFEFIVGLF